MDVERLKMILAESKQEFDALQREANARLTWLDGRIKLIEEILAEEKQPGESEAHDGE